MCSAEHIALSMDGMAQARVTPSCLWPTHLFIVCRASCLKHMSALRDAAPRSPNKTKTNSAPLVNTSPRRALAPANAHAVPHTRVGSECSPSLPLRWRVARAVRRPAQERAVHTAADQGQERGRAWAAGQHVSQRRNLLRPATYPCAQHPKKQTHTRTDTQTHTDTDTDIHRHTQTHIQTRQTTQCDMYVAMSGGTHTDTHAHTYRHTHTHTHVYSSYVYSSGTE